ncbi:hypothetical protein K2173_012734 [Erythroxylum novogranatense]|uniref:1,4-dihydroxy-2-naphthoate octaprenyltransferase n=1 Tax=Erythroxylum novogranatense TaxID=1862640 RepID=A0AAV8SRF5_9ROSI|nr:hypothetical protein K2173_012734 [Erythroxylum novogranatense]
MIYLTLMCKNRNWVLKIQLKRGPHNNRDLKLCPSLTVYSYHICCYLLSLAYLQIRVLLEPSQPFKVKVRIHEIPLMAATLCNLGFGFGSGVKKIEEFYVQQRYYSMVLPNTLKRSSQFCCNAATLLHSNHISGTEIKQQGWHLQVVSDSRINYSYDTNGGEKADEVDKMTLIWRAIKLPIYSVALIPLTVGGAAAYLQTGVFSGGRYIILLASSILIITWLNLSNDVYDFDTGADKGKKESVVNLVGSRSGTLISAYFSLSLGFAGIILTSLAAGKLRAIFLLACAIICGYIYQCPPFRLSYQGLGEPLCFAAFGPFATTAFYLLLGRRCGLSPLPLTSTILSASILVGFTTALILFCSHFHQVEGDRAVGKVSPLVRLGTERGSAVVKLSVVTLYALLFAFGISRALPYTCVLLCAMTIPMGKLVVNFVLENHEDKGKIFMAKYYCVRLHTLFGAALAGGLLAAKMLGQ